MLKKLILGTVQLGMPYGINNHSGMPSSEEANSILETAYRNEVRSLDTADAYGKSQEVVGNYFAANPGQTFKVYTKFKSEAGSIEEQFKRSIQTLSVSSIYGYSYHRFEDIFSDVLRDQLVALKEKGLISKVGVSVYTVQELEKAASVGHIDIIQTPFNLMDHWGARGAAITKAKQAGKEIHVRSVFLQGLFYKTVETLNKNLNPLVPALNEIRRIASQANVDVGTLALQYALSFSEIDGVLLGVETREQLEKNLNATKVKISSMVFEEVSSIQVGQPDLLDPRTWK